MTLIITLLALVAGVSTLSMILLLIESSTLKIKAEIYHDRDDKESSKFYAIEADRLESKVFMFFTIALIGMFFSLLFYNLFII